MTNQKGLSQLRELFATNKDTSFLDKFQFIKSAVTEFHTTGALFPTSKWAARKLCRPLRVLGRGPKKIVELGGGDGAVTKIILDQMRRGDSLIVCELSQDLMDVLKTNIEEHPRYEEFASQISFYCCPAQDLPAWVKADVIICSLPFLNFSLSLVKDIFAKIFEMANDGCTMTYYEYIGIKRVSKVISPKARRERMGQIDSYFSTLKALMFREKSNEWRNLFPIHIYELEVSNTSKHQAVNY
jgi:phosphatidylethanolamine/phosphatidyl-N-methylethanolamine N-methyltransferase